MNNPPRIRNATAGAINIVSKIHIDAFPEFFLTRLGYGFLCELYRGFLNLPEGILLVAEDAWGEVIGFVAGTVAPDHFFAELRRARAVHFVLHAIPALIKQPPLVAAKLYSALSYRGDKPARLDGGALLSSIAVAPGAVGKAVGKALLERYEDEASARGAPFVYLTTDEVGNDLVNHFYTRNGYVVESRFMQGGTRPMLRYIKQVAQARGSET